MRDQNVCRDGVYRSLAITFFFTCYLAAAYGFGLYLFAVLLPDMRQELGFDYRAVGLMSGAAQLGYMIAALIAGPLTPRIGGIRLVFLSILIASFGLVAISVVHATWVLGAALTLLAATAASIWVPMVEVVSRFIPERRQGLVFGIFSSAGGYGALVNGLVVPPLLIAVGWRAVWRDLGLMAIALTVIGYVILRWLAVTSPSGRVRTRSPALINRDAVLSLLRSRRVLMFWALNFCISLGYLPFQTYLASYLRGELGYSVMSTGHLWTVFGAAAAAGGALLGLLADRIGIRRTILVSLGLLLLAGLALAFPLLDWLPFFAAAAFGVSYGSMYGLTPAYVAKMLPPEQGSFIFGFGNVLIGIGGIAGNLVAGYSQDLTGGLRAIYLGVVAAALCLLILAWHLDDDADGTTRGDRIAADRRS
jgi:nitrate/nitrite transporter NarK